MKKLSRYFLSAFALAGLTFQVACGGDSAQPSIAIQDDKTSATAVNSVGEQTVINLEINAPEGFKALNISSDKGVDQQVVDIDADGSYDFVYVTAGKPVGAEVFTFEVVDTQDEKASVQFTVNIRNPLKSYEVNLDAFSEDGSNSAFLDLLGEGTYSLDEIAADLANLGPKIDLYYDLGEVNIEITSPGSIFADDNVETAFGNQARNLTLFAPITLDQFLSVNSVSSELGKVELVDKLFTDAKAALGNESFELVNLTLNPTVAFKTASGHSGAFRVPTTSEGDFPVILPMQIYINQ